MSLGIGAIANLILQDNDTVIYNYGSFNLNEAEFRNKNKVCDGMITVAKSCFAEPEIHIKVRKMPGGKKKQIIKRILVDVDYVQMIIDGHIVIDNCSNCWHRTPDNRYDVMVMHLLFKLFNEYQEEGKMPEYISVYM